MKKFKKPLLINVPEDDHQEAKSPSRVGIKQNKQKSLLLFNQHTVSSSAYNEDDVHQDDEKHTTVCEQFAEYNPKEQKKKGHSIQQQQANSHRHKKFNIIEFEEYMVESKHSKASDNPSQIGQTKQKKLLKNYHRRQFSIEIPQSEEKEEKVGLSSRFAFDLKGENKDNKKKGSGMKEPPAPSNKITQGKTLNRHFVFPTNDDEEMLSRQKVQLKQRSAQKKVQKSIPQQQHDFELRQLDLQWRQKLQILTKSFEKQRQQFYKQKSRLEKQLMIKDGQIEMLQKLITNRYSTKEGIQVTNNNYGDFGDKKQVVSSFVSVMNNDRTNTLLYVSDEKINAMETILLEKDLRVNSLLEKVNELNAVIDKKNVEMEDIKVSLMKSQRMNESLRNEIFIHEKKDESEKLTKQFYKVKEGLIQVQKSKGVSRAKWQEEEQLQHEMSTEKGEPPFRGIDDLHRRLESLKMNRIELESRGRIKSEMNYPQTSKNSTKGRFDFKGKFYDNRERDFNLRGGF